MVGGSFAPGQVIDVTVIGAAAPEPVDGAVVDVERGGQN